MSDNGDEEKKYELQYDGEEEKVEFVSKDGKASATFENGDTYVGAYVNQKRNGKGVYTHTSAGATYDGDFVDGQKHGVGTMTYPDKSKYEGTWRNDIIQGRGVYFYANGDRYSGEFDKGVKHGQGTYVYASDGSMISGAWNEGKFVNGTWSSKDGTTLSGSFNDNIPEGDVHYVLPTGNQQKGAYHKGFYKGAEVTCSH